MSVCSAITPILNRLRERLRSGSSERAPGGAGATHGVIAASAGAALHVGPLKRSGGGWDTSQIAASPDGISQCNGQGNEEGARESAASIGGGNLDLQPPTDHGMPTETTVLGHRGSRSPPRRARIEAP